MTAPAFTEALGVWLKIGCLGFGGPAGQIALMHRVLVDEKKWIDEPRFLHALNFCMLLPGPEAQQLATYVGWLLHRTWGGVAAGVLFVLPGALVMLALSFLYVRFSDIALVEGLFYGVKAAVIAIVIEAVLRISKRALKTPLMYGLAAAAFIAIFAFAAPFPAIVAAAAAIGLFGARARPDLFVRTMKAQPPQMRAAAATGAFRNAAVAALLWIGPLLALLAAFGPDHFFTEAAIFFSKMAVVTFGGAYAVLAYVAQEAVATHGWLAPGEMLDGLGLAETTPGPLVLVLQFVGFLGGWRADTGLSPFASGAAGAAIALWFTFVPCFFWIFLGAPFMERLREARAVNAALAAVTAAVVGVVLNLALWFSVHVLFARVGEWTAGVVKVPAPDFSSLDPIALGLALASGLALLRFKVGMIGTLAAAAAIGAGLKLGGL